jgi:putative hydrolase of the HAD superfamily
VSYRASVDLRGLLLDYAGVLDDPGDAWTGAPPMAEVVRRVREAGIGTALVSNAAAVGDALAEELFDAVVLSGAVGIAKPHAEIYRLAARRLGLDPRECVFVDDLRRNVDGAVTVGMVGVHHRDVTSTLTELEAVLGLELAF